MNETKLSSIAQLQVFLKATPEVSFSGIGEKDDNQRYAHISRVLKRFDPRAWRGTGLPATHQRLQPRSDTPCVRLVAGSFTG